MSDDTKEINLKETVNLPQTDFPIRAGLSAKEPELLEFWEKEKIYQQILKQQDSFSNIYTLHDGPPYPNGDIHMGHALNKILKDIVVKSKGMQNQKSSYLPGWDCHGLPIEIQVIKKLKQEQKEHLKDNIEHFRELCKTFSLQYVDTQKEEFKRLGIFGEWETPYLTLNKEYEAGVVELFGRMAQNGLIHQGKKPIHWCSSCETALAEAEIEYNDKKSPSIFIRFSITKKSPELEKILAEKTADILIWTTTPWTLPANTAIAAHPDFTYKIAQVQDKNYIFVADLESKLAEKLNFQKYQIIGEIKGRELLNTITKHPFIDRESKIVLANYITKEDGTGFVHIAPGHGMEDYLVGLEYNLPIIMPVDNSGKFTSEVPEFQGQFVFDANKAIGQKMEKMGTLLKLEWQKHSYPHCWRCKNPIIFRATEQWFVYMDKPMKHNGKTLRESALEEIKKTIWYPSWGEKRITAMIESRPDWCISRQRYWGIPIPVFLCQKCGNPEMTGNFNKAVVELVKKEGAISWFTKSAKEILPPNLACSKCGSTNFEKEKDILDVWFESGSSWGSVLETNPQYQVPAQLYLEGSDQHRGWFQSSLLIGIGANGHAPYEGVLTHGFITDEKGRKMSKSEGNVISPLDVIKNYGSDILRWWVASTDFKSSDISIAQSILNQARDSYSKTRNTIRFLLSNLFDFEPKKDSIAYEKLNEIDQWALLKLNQLVKDCTQAYNDFEFHLITYKIHDFCAVTLSSLYLDMTKDRLYCDSADSLNRKSTQTVLFQILDSLLKLVAPILVFTSEDAYQHFNKPAKKPSIHLEQMPQTNQKYNNQILVEKWKKLLAIKDLAYQQLEALRSQKIIKSFLEAKVDLTLSETINFTDWESLLIVSQVNIQQGPAQIIKVKKLEKPKCERCWKLKDLEKNLCYRCSQSIGKI